MRGWKEQVFYISIGVGMALATSSFTMVSGLFAVASLGWILAGVVLAALFCMGVSLSVGELASMFPSAPGLRTYFKVAFGEHFSLVMVYLYLIFAILIAGLESFVFSQVFNSLVPGAPPALIAIVLLAGVVALNLVGFHLPRWSQITTSVGVVSLILFSGIASLLRPKMSLADMFYGGSSGGGFAALPGLIGMGIFLFTGFEWVAPLGVRPKAYEKKVPLSMPVAVAILALAYCLFVVGTASQLPAKAIQGNDIPQITYFRALYGPLGPYLGLGLSIFAIISTFNAGILGGAQLIYLVAREGKLPPWCATLSLRSGCPIGAILLLGSLATASSLVVMTFRLEIPAALVGAAIMCAVYAGFLIATTRLRALRPNAPRPFPTFIPKWAQWVAAVALTVIGVQTLFSEPASITPTCIGLVLSCAAAWLLALRSASVRPSTAEVRPSQAAAD